MSINIYIYYAVYINIYIVRKYMWLHVRINICIWIYIYIVTIHTYIHIWYIFIVYIYIYIEYVIYLYFNVLFFAILNNNYIYTRAGADFVWRRWVERGRERERHTHIYIHILYIRTRTSLFMEVKHDLHFLIDLSSWCDATLSWNPTWTANSV
jgi:hypothetical protein